MTDIIYPPGAYCRAKFGFDGHAVKRSLFDPDYLWCMHCKETIVAVPWPGEPWPGLFITQHLVVEWP